MNAEWTLLHLFLSCCFTFDFRQSIFSKTDAGNRLPGEGIYLEQENTSFKGKARSRLGGKEMFDLQELICLINSKPILDRGLDKLSLIQFFPFKGK